jgi:malate permease and related proteins
MISLDQCQAWKFLHQLDLAFRVISCYISEKTNCNHCTPLSPLIMEIFYATLKSVAILMGIGLIGFWILARRIVPLDIMKVLMPLVLEVALPCMIFYNIINKFNPAEMPGWWTLPLWWIVMTSLFLVLSLLGMLYIDRKNRGVVGLSLFYPNATFFPLGIIPFIYGPDTNMLIELFLFTLFFPLAVFNGYIFFFRSKKTTHKFNIKDSKIFNRVLLATLLSVGLKLTHTDVYVPSFVVEITGILGAIALPLLMLTIGGNVFIDFSRRGKINYFSSFKFVITKNLLFPAFTLLFLMLLRPPQSVANLIIIQSVMPPLSAVPIFTARAKGNVSLANQFLVSSFICSIVTIPLCMWCYTVYY